MTKGLQDPEEHGQGFFTLRAHAKALHKDPIRIYPRFSVS